MGNKFSTVVATQYKAGEAFTVQMVWRLVTELMYMLIGRKEISAFRIVTLVEWKQLVANFAVLFHIVSSY